MKMQAERKYDLLSLLTDPVNKFQDESFRDEISIY